MTSRETHAALLAAAEQIQDEEIRERAIERVLAGAKRDGVELERAGNTEIRDARSAFSESSGSAPSSSNLNDTK